MLLTIFLPLPKNYYLKNLIILPTASPFIKMKYSNPNCMSGLRKLILFLSEKKSSNNIKQAKNIKWVTDSSRY